MKTSVFRLTICLLLLSFPAFAQNGVVDESSPASVARSSAPGFTVMGELMNLAGDLGLECRKCNLDALVAGQNSPHFLLNLLTDDVSRLKTFMTKVLEKWPMGIESLDVKPCFDPSVGSSSVEITLDLFLPADGVKPRAPALEEIFRPVQELPFFLPFADQNLAGPHLFGFSLLHSGPTQIQVVFESFAAISPMLNRPGLPGKARTISRTRFGAKDLVTVHFTEAEDALPTKDLLAVCSALSDVAQVREITTPPGSKQLVISLSVPTEKIEECAGLLAQKAGLEAESCDITMEGAQTGNLRLTANVRPTPQKLVSPELQSLLSAGLSPVVRENLKISWNPHKMCFSVELPSGPEVSSPEDVSRVKALAVSLGFSPEGNKVEKSKETGEERLVLCFGKETGPGGQPASKEVSQGLKEILNQGEVLENVQTAQGRKQVIRLPFAQVSALAAALAGETGQSLVKFQVSCLYPMPATVDFTLADGPGDQSQAAYRVLNALMKAPLPWNLPEESLKQGLIVQSLSIESNGDFELSGVTLKSRLIFSSLFPVLQAIPGLSEPFFSQGNYRDHPLGRLMTFRVTVQCLNSK